MLRLIINCSKAKRICHDTVVDVNLNDRLQAIFIQKQERMDTIKKIYQVIKSNNIKHKFIVPRDMKKKTLIKTVTNCLTVVMPLLIDD